MDLISREEALKVFGNIHPLDHNTNAYKSKIEQLPIIESRPKGEWRINDSFWGTSNPYCSRCGSEIEPEVRYAIGLPPFCFSCGADMRKEK